MTVSGEIDMNDRFGNATGTASSTAARHYDRAVDAHLHAWPGVLEALDAAIASAPDFALPHALKALTLFGRGQRSQAQQSIASAQACSTTAPSVVSGQVAVMTSIVGGRPRDALAQVLEHARLHPTDALTASTALGAYGLFAFSGRADHDVARLAFTEALAPHYPEDFPWLLAYRGWARIEAGQVDDGLAMAQHAISLRPANGHNAHIVLHGLYEAGEPSACLAFVDDWLPSYPRDALLWGHLHWHAALAELELQQSDAAVARMVGPIMEYLPCGTPFMGLADVASLLWRLGLRKVRDLPWSTAQDHVERHFPDGSNVFGELHLTMLAAARSDRGALLAAFERLRATSGKGHEGAAVAMRWTEALIKLLDGDSESAREHLDYCQAAAVRLGGSHAQRSVVSATRQALRVPMAN
jgi:hypothetical protein